MSTQEREPSCWKVMGYSSHEEFLRKARARTRIMTIILKRKAEAQKVTPEMLNRVVDL
ncbi:hypothetical protein ST201phi2-1p450 [Pseudomonas phage 201phi2-1]|uniref:Uncharacterized protein n=1 Tax=Pseudomonas phage 201phi2-1 TaxID=198110 RepID=B3FJV8_BP201|nr:hypothetical protein ST201phi2-1p450 [Pseudomonas phage 201phi2-1]ABY63273.1 hypothetical protein 201phi2-1p450 [Pseudomonas phage 201phi2-1]